MRAPFHPYFLLKLLLCTWFVSCGPLQTGPSSVKIIGGQPTQDSEFNSVVAFMRDQLTLCTGTLIAPDLVLTAAHCFEKSARGDSSSIANIRVVAGPRSILSNETRVAKIAEVKIHPNFWRDHRGATDFAWVRISPSFESVTPSVLPSNRSELDAIIYSAKTAEIVGYGLSSLSAPKPGEPPLTGTKNVGVVPIQYRTGIELFAGSSQVDSCSGDSGGALFLTSDSFKRSSDHRILAGVTSRGPSPCATDFEAGAYGLTSEAICWLRTSAQFQINEPILADFCIREIAESAIVQDDPIVLAQEMKDACVNDALSESARHDLKELFLVARVPTQKSPESCAKLDQFLKTVKTLNLSNRHLRQLTWLRFAKNLETIVATDNLITSILHLSQLENLKIVDVRNNMIDDLESLKQLSKQVRLFGLTTQAINTANTTYRTIAEQGAAAGTDSRTLVIALREILATGDIPRKSRDLNLRKQLNLDNRGLRSLQAIRGLENLESVSIANNPDLKNWDDLFTLPRLQLLRIASSDSISNEVRNKLQSRAVRIISTP